MKYAELIGRVLAEAGAELPLPELLGRIDAINKSVPTFVELNEALARLRRPTTTQAAYDEAVLENKKYVAQALRNAGTTQERQDEVLGLHRREWEKP